MITKDKTGERIGEKRDRTGEGAEDRGKDLGRYGWDSSTRNKKTHCRAVNQKNKKIGTGFGK